MIFFFAPLALALIIAILAARIKHELNPYLYFSKTLYALKVFAICSVVLLSISVGGVYVFIEANYHPEADAVPAVASVDSPKQDAPCPPSPDHQPQACDYTTQQLLDMAGYKPPHQ